MTEKEWSKTFAMILKRRMEVLNVDQKALSRSTGLSIGSISNYITGKKIPNVRSLLKISRELEIDVGNLIDFGDIID